MTDQAVRIAGVTPDVAATFVRQALHRAIDGFGPWPGAAEAAEAQLREQRGHVDRAVHEVIENHVRWSAAQGFLTNLGGLTTAAVTVPANVSGLALMQCRMVAGIAHLRGYDLGDPRVRNAVLLTLLGEDAVERLVRATEVPAPPMALATAPVHDATLEQLLCTQVTTDLFMKVGGRRAAISVARRTPLVGGVVGLGTDAFATWRIGRYADRELRPRARR